MSRRKRLRRLKSEKRRAARGETLSKAIVRQQKREGEAAKRVVVDLAFAIALLPEPGSSLSDL